MGKQLLDQFTFLHFCVGGCIYYWGVSLTAWLVIHDLFEVVENTRVGMQVINNITFWPGGKPSSDSFENAIGDIIAGMIGWGVANYIDELGKRKGWYNRHID